MAVAGDAAIRVGEKLDEWLGHLPPLAARQIQGRLDSSDPVTHLAGFWEFYLAEAFRRLDFEVEPDIGLDDHEGRRRPDFRFVRGDLAFRLEATVIMGDDAVDRRDRTRVDQLYEAIERIRNRDFLLHTGLRVVGPNTPGRGLRNEIDKWLDGLDPDDLLEANRAESTIIEHDGWSVAIQATAKKPHLRDEPDFGVLGSKWEGSDLVEVSGNDGTREIELEGFKQIDDLRPLVNGLRAKARHGYELDDEPFIIGALCAGTFIEDRDIAQGLFGQIEYRGSEGEFTGGGLWFDNGGKPRYRDVSAVLTATGLTAAAAAVVEPCLWISPVARRPLPAHELPWRRLEARRTGGFDDVEARRASEDILGLYPRWPYAAPPGSG